MSTDERIARALRALEEAGVPGASIDVEGHEGEIAALRLPGSAWERMVGDDEGARVAALVKAAGFRYVAVDLRPADEPAPA